MAKALMLTSEGRFDGWDSSSAPSITVDFDSWFRDLDSVG